MSTPSTVIAGRYRLVKLLGAGGMGVVWQAWDERLERPVALKMLRTQPELSEAEREIATSRAMREARITAGLRHSHAVTVYDVVEHEGHPCLVMQLIESTPLSVLLREHGTLTPGEAARIGAEVSSALAAAHKMRIVHRDVKPGNVLIAEDGSAMISDFGISHALGDATITVTGMIHGTPAYLAPEVARGRPSSFASDVFSLGSTLYAMLEGKPPFGDDKNAIALLHKVARGGYARAKHAGPLAPLLREMLSADPKRRPTMTSIAASLSSLSTTPQRPTRPAPAPPSMPNVALTQAATEAIALAREPASVAGEPDAALTAAPDEPTDVDAPAGTRDATTEKITHPQHPTAPTVPATPSRLEPITDPLPPKRTVPLDQPTRFEPPTAATEPLIRRGPTAPPERASVPAAPVRETAPPRRRRIGAVVGVLVVLTALAVGAVLLVTYLRQESGTAAAPTASRAPATTSAPASQTPTTAPSPVVSSPAPAPAPVPQPPTAEQRVAQTITDYYALVPDDLDGAWPMMTADYQENHAGGRANYDAFWSEIADVEISDVTASASGQGQATLTYSFVGGGIEREVTTFQLVEEDGMLKIAATDVVSSGAP